jgi:hypothetical protein
MFEAVATTAYPSLQVPQVVANGVTVNESKRGETDVEYTLTIVVIKIMLNWKPVLNTLRFSVDWMAVWILIPDR